ncbi:fatty acyl-CoA reductase 1-like isoform X2 [Frieseomelitta varia]|uniref:fatty acyl-CoA reductase 1-like isoform X2 n=1 Tax=Frieseomelitta varia TaxID=561572 RepID=UPI001CB687BD|nr:fatty acyl-CoA reductase 1-like isoform X2 [Frieseomelitta varia]
MDRMDVIANANSVNDSENSDSIEGFYAANAILVTGATGFVGKGILEKLMRVCPRIAAIFLLIRPKRSQTLEQRFKKLLDDPIYDYVKEKDPSILSKIHPVQGDVSLPDLGLSPKDRIMLTENVNIVFHVAATVRFNEPLNVAVNINTKGTARVIQLCKELKHAISVVYVSTAYSNAHLSEIEEKIYSTCLEPSAVIDICEGGNKMFIDQLNKRILKTYPNTYTFTKNLAEQIISSNSDSFPVAIVRPSIIGASHEEPCPGWLDNIYGVTAIFLQIGKGILKAVTANRDAKLDLVPIDYVVDTTICAAWHITLHRDNKPKVYNCTSNAPPITWGQLKQMYTECSRDIPMNDVISYPYCVIVSNKLIYSVLSIFLHVLPAFIVDIFLILRGKRPMMIKVNKHLNQLLAAFSYFNTHEWTFHRCNITEMTMKVKTLEDSDIVKLDMRDMNWKKYIANYQIGIKKFILKESSDSVKSVRHQSSLLYWMYLGTQVFGVVALSATIALLALNISNF